MQTGRRKLGRIYAQLVQKRPEIVSVSSFFIKIRIFVYTGVVCFFVSRFYIRSTLTSVKCVLTNLDSLE